MNNKTPPEVDPVREQRYLDAIVEHGPRVKHIADALGMRSNHFQSWLVDASFRYPIYQDDNGRVYYEGGKIYDN